MKSFCKFFLAATSFFFILFHFSGCGAAGSKDRTNAINNGTPPAYAEAFSGSGAMRVARSHFAVAEMADGRLLFAGGISDATTLRTVESSTEIYSIATHAFSDGPSLLQARAEGSAVTLSTGEVLITGGYREAVPFGEVAAVEILNVSGTSIRAGGSMLRPRFGHHSVALPGGQVLIVGGWERRPKIWPDEPYFLAAVSVTELFNPQTGASEALTDLNVNWRQPIRSTPLSDGRVVLTDTAQIVVYDPATKQFTPVGAFEWRHLGSAAVFFSNASMAIFCGWMIDGGLTVTTTQIDRVALMSGQFTTPARTAFLAEYCSAAPMRDGRVLISHDAGTELYDPVSHVIKPGPSLSAYRRMPLAIRLRNGDILIVGGTTAAGDNIASTELFQ